MKGLGSCVYVRTCESGSTDQSCSRSLMEQSIISESLVVNPLTLINDFFSFL